MKHAKQWLLWGPFAVAGVVLSIWYGVWRAGADAMESALVDVAADAADHGVVVVRAPLRARGFPFFLRGEVDDISIERGKDRFEADRLYLHALPWAPQRIVFSTAPSLRLSTPDGVWAIRAADMRASIEAKGESWIFKVEAASFDAAKAGAAATTGRVVINVTPHSAAGADIAVRILDAYIRNDRGDASIARLDAALTAQTDLRGIVLHGFDSEIGAARLGAAGALRIDDEGFLAGQLGVRVENPVALAHALRVIGAIKAEESQSLETGLALLTAHGRIEAPLVFADGRTMLAGVRIARAPRPGQP